MGVSRYQLVRCGWGAILPATLYPVIYIWPTCYEHARDQGTLGSVAGCRHSRTPGRTHGFLIGTK
jgi:hypothetical protein